VYLLDELCLDVACVITKADGSLPETSATVALVNYPLCSMWNSVRVSLNDVPINPNAENFGYRSYITACLSYSSMVKGNLLSAAGYYADLHSRMEVEYKVLVIMLSLFLA